MSDPIPFAGKVPLVGQAKVADIHHATLSVVLTCVCGTGRPIVIGNIDQLGRCQGCGAEFLITEAVMKRQGPHVQFAVNVGRRVPSVAVPPNGEMP